MPLCAITQILPDIHVGLWHLEESADILSAQFPIESYAMRDAAVKGIAHERRRGERWAARLILLRMGITSNIGYTPMGRPFFLDESAYLSVSHTADWVAVAVGKQPCGLDIEQWGVRAARVASRFLNVGEISLLGGDRANDVATLLWSAKEAVYKLWGEKEVDFSSHLQVAPFHYSPLPGMHSFMVQEQRTLQRKCFRVYYQSFAGFVMTLAVDADK